MQISFNFQALIKLGEWNEQLMQNDLLQLNGSANGSSSRMSPATGIQTQAQAYEQTMQYQAAQQRMVSNSFVGKVTFHIFDKKNNFGK